MRKLPILFFLLVSLFAQAEWPQFLGPHRNGAAGESEKPLPETFPADAGVLWSHEIGSGFSGPVVAKGKAVMFHRLADEVVVEALDAKNGKALWKFSAHTDYTDSFGMSDGPRGTPVVVDDRVFAHGADGMLFALDLTSGRLLWKFDSKAETNSPQGFFGRACSPLVIGGKVILTTGGTRLGKPAGVIALNAATGGLLWHSTEDEASYSSPVAIGPVEKPRLLCWMRNDLWMLDANTGGVIHHKRLRSEMEASVNAATPLPIGGGRYFLSSGYGVGASIWTLEPVDKPFEPQEAGDDLIESHYSTPVFSDGHLYGFHDRQETGQRLRCIDLAKKEVRWESPKVPGGHVILVGDKLVVVTEQGELWIARASPEKFEQLQVWQILRAGHRSPPAFSEGVLYARDGGKLVAVKLR